MKKDDDSKDISNHTANLVANIVDTLEHHPDKLNIMLSLARKCRLSTSSSNGDEIEREIRGKLSTNETALLNDLLNCDYRQLHWTNYPLSPMKPEIRIDEESGKEIEIEQEQYLKKYKKINPFKNEEVEHISHIINADIEDGSLFKIMLFKPTKRFKKEP